MEQLWTRLFIPINSLPSRIPLHVRYFPRICIEVARYSKRPLTVAPFRPQTLRNRDERDEPLLGIGGGSAEGWFKTRRRTESGEERRDGEEGQSPRQAENLAAPSRDDAAPQ